MFSEAPITIDSWDSYLYAQSRGYEPLINDRLFTLPISLRQEIQSATFSNDVQFYHWFYNVHPTRCCEETGQPIRKDQALSETNRFSAANVSHILTRGNYPEMRYDPRNCNLLLFEIHGIWENAVEAEQKKLKIWYPNQQRIETLLTDYQQLN